jgi:hypothetical protein
VQNPSPPTTPTLPDLQRLHRLRGGIAANMVNGLVSNFMRLYAIDRRHPLDPEYHALLCAAAAAVRTLTSNAPSLIETPGLWPTSMPPTIVLMAVEAIEGLRPTRRLGPAGRRPQLTEGERLLVILNPEGWTSDEMARALDRSPTLIFARRRTVARACGLIGRHAGNRLAHLEPEWSPDSDLPMVYTDPREARVRWNQLYRRLSGAGPVETSGPYRLHAFPL